MPSEDGKDAAILKELREISNRHSPYHQSNEPKKRPRLEAPSSGDKENLNLSINPTAGEEDYNEDSDSPCGKDSNNFLSQTGENRDLNQYWYSKNTIEVLCNAIREGLSVSSGLRVAFLSTPSLFFSLSSEERKHCTLFDFDKSWESCSGYQFYDYNDPTNVTECCHGAYDLIVIDPPFISQSVWENYATTAKLLMKGDSGKIIATTVDENAVLMKALFGCNTVLFRPSIPHLVYQYSVYTNFPSSVLAIKNSELT